MEYYLTLPSLMFPFPFPHFLHFPLRPFPWPRGSSLPYSAIGSLGSAVNSATGPGRSPWTICYILSWKLHSTWQRYCRSFSCEIEMWCFWEISGVMVSS